MAFSKITLSETKEKYGLLEKKSDIFPLDITPLAVSSWLQECIKRSVKLPLNSEKSKSEAIVYPILSEIKEICDDSFSIFSGVTLQVKGDKKMVGECDFIFSAKTSMEIEAPIFTLIEAKNDNIDNAYGQCVAQMYAAKLFNEEHKKDIPVIFGCITNAENWQFLKLEGNMVTFHNSRFYINQLEQILGVFKFIVDSSIKN